MNFIGKFLYIISLSLVLSISCEALAKTPPSTPSINGERNLITTITHAINMVDPNLNIGIAIKSMKNGEILYSRNEKRPLVPASTLKIFTAEAALIYLGKNYQFTTRFYTDAKSLNNGILDGDLYLVHSGDPTLTYTNLIDLMSELKSLNLREITGNVYIDMTAYDQLNYGPGWVWNDRRYCYAAPISASIINHNCLSFQIAPAKTAGHPANIVQSPHYYYSGFQNSVITKAKASRSCYIQLGTSPDSSISVSGCMSKGRYTQGISTVVNDIMGYNKSLVRALFSRSGIEINGVIAPRAAPSNLHIVVSHQSKPLNQLVSEMLKKSDNIIAGSIFKKLGETYFKKPGSWENGSMAVSKILTSKAYVNTTNMNVLDGSGLSPYNRITPEQMLQVLNFAYHDPLTNYEFISALPVAGVDGTLKNRLQNIAWKVRAKTGTISSVNSLAGYAITRDKEPLAFVIIINGRLGMGWKYKELEDRIVIALTKFSRKN